MSGLNPPLNKEKFLGATYRELEERTAVAYANWSPWLTGKKDPRLKTLEEIAQKLEMPLAEFIDAFVERRARTMQRSQKSE